MWMSWVGLWNGRGEEDYCHAEGHVKTCLNLFSFTGVRSGRDGTEVTMHRPLCGGAGPMAGMGVMGGNDMACELAPASGGGRDSEVRDLSLSLFLSLSLSLSVSLSLSLSLRLRDLRRVR